MHERPASLIQSSVLLYLPKPKKQPPTFQTLLQPSSCVDAIQMFSSPPLWRAPTHCSENKSHGPSRPSPLHRACVHACTERNSFTGRQPCKVLLSGASQRSSTGSENSELKFIRTLTHACFLSSSCPSVLVFVLFFKGQTLQACNYP